MASAKRRPDAVKAVNQRYMASDKYKATRKARREGPARETILEQKRDYHERNSDEINAKRRADREADPDAQRRSRAIERELKGDVLNERDRRWRATHREHLRAYNRLRTFGLTLEQFESMLAEQNELCAICGIHMESSGGVMKNGVQRTGVCVDHDHETGKVRGLLCGHCNKGIGLLRDDPVILAAAIAYLQR